MTNKDLIKNGSYKACFGFNNAHLEQFFSWACLDMGRIFWTDLYVKVEFPIGSQRNNFILYDFSHSLEIQSKNYS